jgi:predicted aspartyl protease
MADKRIKDLAATATAPAGDDFIAIDGESNNTRKIAADSFLQDAPSDGTLYGRQDGDWEEAASPDDIPLTATFVYDGTAETTEFIVGNIPNDWQRTNSDLTELSIGTSATSIGSEAFYNCTGFTGNLVIPNSVTSIGSSAFLFCSNFTGNLVIPNSVTSIGISAFEDCQGFTGSLVIPNSVTSIGSSAFNSCTGFTGNLVIGNSVTSIGSSAFRNCTGFTGNLVIPNSVTSIGDYAFFDCTGFTGNLVIPNSVTSIGSSAFLFCSNFTGNLVIPNSVTSIGSSAFYGCFGLTDAYLNLPIGSIGSYAFSYSGITNVFIGPDATGYTLGAGQTIGGQSGITVSLWTNYPNVP